MKHENEKQTQKLAKTTLPYLACCSALLSLRCAPRATVHVHHNVHVDKFLANSDRGKNSAPLAPLEEGSRSMWQGSAPSAIQLNGCPSPTWYKRLFMALAAAKLTNSAIQRCELKKVFPTKPSFHQCPSNRQNPLQEYSTMSSKPAYVSPRRL